MACPGVSTIRTRACTSSHPSLAAHRSSMMLQRLLNNRRPAQILPEVGMKRRASHVRAKEKWTRSLSTSALPCPDSVSPAIPCQRDVASDIAR
jgi:hypothetical protein